MATYPVQFQRRVTPAALAAGAARRRFMSASPDSIEVNFTLGGLAAMGALESPEATVTRLLQDMDAVRQKLRAKLADVGFFQQAKQWVTTWGGQSFEERVAQWESSVEGWRGMALDAVKDPDKFDAWAKVGVNIMAGAQNYANEMNDATLAASAAQFIRDMPKSVGIAWKAGVSAVTEATTDLTSGAGSILTSATWNAAKPLVLAAGGIGLAIFLLGKALKSADVKIATPFVTVGGGGGAPAAGGGGGDLTQRVRGMIPARFQAMLPPARGAVSGYAPRRRRKRRRKGRR